MKTYKTTIDCGKIDWNGTGRKVNPATVTVEYRLEAKYIGGKIAPYWEFSACGDIWNARHTEMIAGGQILDELAKVCTLPKFREVYALWQKHHLNGMTAGSPAQMDALKGFKLCADKVTWSWYDKKDITENTDRFGRHVTDDKATAKAAEAAGHYVSCAEWDEGDQKHIYLVSKGLYTDHSFIYEGKPYKYGDAWLVTEIPEADKKRIRALFGITKADEEAAEAAARGEAA